MILLIGFIVGKVNMFGYVNYLILFEYEKVLFWRFNLRIIVMIIFYVILFDIYV